jgi:exodeoxyribonuclease V beta subunit
MFLHAEGETAGQGYAAGAFRFRKAADNPLPFEPVGAAGRKARAGRRRRALPGAGVCTHRPRTEQADDYRPSSPTTAPSTSSPAERRARRLRGAGRRVPPPDAGRYRRAGARPREAAAIRRALARREVASVYLSDKDSVIDSEEAVDVLRWLQAVASPLDGGLARAAFASATCALPLAELARLSSDELAWEERVEQLKSLHLAWQRQGVLAMLRRFIHELGLPAKLLHTAGGERRLTNLLHLAELLQEASRELDGEQALIRWFGEQVEGGRGRRRTRAAPGKRCRAGEGGHGAQVQGPGVSAGLSAVRRHGAQDRHAQPQLLRIRR